MRRIKIVGLCLVAVFAFAAVAVSSASAAEPEWGRCIATKKGNYSNGNCTTKSSKPHKGSFEWYGGAAALCYPKKGGEYTSSSCTSKSSKPHKGKYEKTAGPGFTGKGGKGILETELRSCKTEEEGYKAFPVAQCLEHLEEGEPRQFKVWGSPEVECESEDATGEATGIKEVGHVHVTFHECVLFETVPCTSAGAAEGEIRTEELKGELGYIEKATHKVGVVLHPASGTAFAKFQCGSTDTLVVGEGNATQGKFYSEKGEWYPTSQEQKEGQPIPAGFTEAGGGDGLISPITPVNQMTSSFTQVYTARRIGANGRVSQNVPTSFEGGPFESLETITEATEAPGESFMWGPSSESITDVNTTEGPTEIKG